MLKTPRPFPGTTAMRAACATLVWAIVGSTLVACVPDAGSPNSGTGGSNQPGGAGGVTGSGGANGTGGRTSTGTGGQVPTGSGGNTAATGGTGGGGVATGGRGGAANSGGRSTGGAGSGGPGTGGTGTGGTGTGGTGVGGSTHTGVWKVMLLGDSVTGTCYPQVLSKDLIAGGHTNFQFVGTSTNNQSCGTGTPSVKTEAHGGYGVTYLPSPSTRPQCTKQAQGCGTFAELQAWAAEKPDMVLMHFATNDAWDGQPTTTILAAYVAVIAEFRKQNPNVIFFVSKIIPNVNAVTNVINLNAAVTPAWASTNATITSPTYIIDHWTGFNTTTDTVEGVHPNAAGAQKMSTASYNALLAAGYF